MSHTPCAWRFLYFYPRSPRGERHNTAAYPSSTDPFLSTLPARGATEGSRFRCRVVQFLSTLPARGATGRGLSPTPAGTYFYPRSPRGERLMDRFAAGGEGAFLSTLPARGATSSNLDSSSISTDFYPRSPRGERRNGGRDLLCDRHFYPRSPRGERLDAAGVARVGDDISIHAPREGSDFLRSTAMRRIWVFLSTLPARGATAWNLDKVGDAVFLSTLPARGATSAPPCMPALSWYFYPRSPRGERRPFMSPRAFSMVYFYPRSPRGERRMRARREVMP